MPEFTAATFPSKGKAKPAKSSTNKRPTIISEGNNVRRIMRVGNREVILPPASSGKFVWQGC